MSFNLYSLSMHIMDFTIEQTVVYYKLELLDEESGECKNVLRRYSAIASFRQQLLKELETSCQCSSDAPTTCKQFLNALKKCQFPAKTWFPTKESAIQPEVVAQRATDLSYFFQDVVALAREHSPLCLRNQMYFEIALAEILGAPQLTTKPPVPPRSRKGERSASCELAATTACTSGRDRSGSAPITTKRLIL